MKANAVNGFDESSHALKDAGANGEVRAEISYIEQRCVGFIGLW